MSTHGCGHIEGLKAMDLALLGELFLAAVWMQLGCMADGHDKRGSHLSMKGKSKWRYTLYSNLLDFRNYFSFTKAEPSEKQKRK